MKVKVGPITVSYKGEASFQEKDEAAQRVVIKASGKETRGSGNAAALVTAQLKDEGDATTVVITTDLTISGKAAQFGRGVLADVSTNLIGQFARNLEADLLGGSAAVGCGIRIGGHRDAARQPQSDAGDSVDLLKVVARADGQALRARRSPRSPRAWRSASCWAGASAHAPPRTLPTSCRLPWLRLLSS